jgi:hypothetical protein
MQNEELDKRTLHFEIFVHRQNETAVFQIKGVAPLSATRSCVTMAWPNYPGATSGRSITFDQIDIDSFVRNDKKQSFTLLGKSYTPDFIYIQKEPRVYKRH